MEPDAFWSQRIGFAILGGLKLLQDVQLYVQVWSSCVPQQGHKRRDEAPSPEHSKSEGLAAAAAVVADQPLLKA